MLLIGWQRYFVGYKTLWLLNESMNRKKKKKKVGFPYTFSFLTLFKNLCFLSKSASSIFIQHKHHPPTQFSYNTNSVLHFPTHMLSPPFSLNGKKGGILWRHHTIWNAIDCPSLLPFSFCCFMFHLWTSVWLVTCYKACHYYLSSNLHYKVDLVSPNIFVSTQQ